MTNKSKKQTAKRNAVIAAVCAVSKAAEKQWNLGNEGQQLLVDEDVDASLSADMQAALDIRGLEWNISLNGASFSPFAYAPASYDERRARPEKWPDAHGMAIDELELMGRAYDDDNVEYMKALAEQEKMAQKAIDAAEATITGLHEIVRAAKGRWKCLRALEAETISKFCIPFVGFRHDKCERELYACFKEGSYDFCMLVPFDESEGRWDEIGVETVDELLWGLGCGLPELLIDDGSDVAGAKGNEGKLSELSEEEAIAIVKEYLVD